jgi:1-acyl-sn-glycerol-3-phosphate acyltransferase
VVSNHISSFDIMAVLSLPGEMAIGVKRWVMKVPLMGSMAKECGFIVLEGEPERFFDAAAELLRQGVSIVIYPEGSRMADGRMHRFHKGAFELAVRTGADVLPILLTNTQSCMPKDAVWVSPHNAVVRVLPRVTAANFDYGAGAKALAAHVKAQMLQFETADWRLAQSGAAFSAALRSLYDYRGNAAEAEARRVLADTQFWQGVEALVPLEGDVLELFCGYGVLSTILAWKALGRRVLGVDGDGAKTALASCTIRADNAVKIRFEEHDPCTWEFAPADAVILTGMPAEWPPERRECVVAKAWDCLRAGGTLILRDTGARQLDKPAGAVCSVVVAAGLACWKKPGTVPS